ncbi:Protein of unknown function precursor [Flavobacterium indicum GPTSA100-9 = DSM 17447]|uniref:Uncharacterized protein n=1 Tax=Flavobacterium indicum (strain DSM 17447 / CIP 109464 / GPTSA100-9) TaxID=1094466 RepID=H8XRA4_FLAIG|nr:Protein of unknown function precursor [Flavobacterium indicum GPTSA100-9 = DSM 17447]
MKNIKLIVVFTILFNFSYSQSTIQTVIRGGELLVTGLSIFKTVRTDSSTKTVDNKLVATVCVKNKLQEKITVKLTGKDEDDVAITKELVIPYDGKECVFELPKGIYTYEIVLPNKEIYQKGEYKFEEEITITVKKD